MLSYIWSKRCDNVKFPTLLLQKKQFVFVSLFSLIFSEGKMTITKINFGKSDYRKNKSGEKSD